MPGKTIVIIADTGHVDGGAAQVAIVSAKALADAGQQVHFIAGKGPIDGRLAHENMRVTCLNLASINDSTQRKKAFFQGLWNVSAARKMTHLLSDMDPENTLIHIHTWNKVLSASFLPAIKNFNIPIVITLHDYFSICPNGGLYDYVEQKICDRKPMSAPCVFHNCDARRASHKFWRVGRQVLQDQVARLPQAPDTFIYVSDFSRRVLQTHLPADRLHVTLDNPYSGSQRPPVDPAANDRFLFVGRLSPEKGPHVLAEAARRARIKICFAGEGSLRASLEAAYPEHTYTGWLSPSGVDELLASSRALIFPSLWYETLGLVVQEAMSRGVPAAVAGSSAAATLVRDNNSGLLFKSGDVEDLTRCLRRLMNDDDVRRLGSGAYAAFWHSPPTTERHVSGLLGIYHETCEIHRSRKGPRR